MNTNRLYFLDWVRILAFFLLIFYHTGMYYVTWDWHVKSPWASEALEPFMLMSGPWRLGLLFLVSGVASHFILSRMSRAQFVRARTVRLMLPLIFGMLAVVPIQPYLEVVEKVGYQGSFLDFMQLYLRAYDGFCRGSDCLDLPTWNHLWFVAYLWPYTLALALLAALARGGAWTDGVARMLTGWRALAVPAAALAVLRLTLFPHFPTTHDFVHDWYENAHYFFMFMLGYALARKSEVWAQFERLRWPALGIACACWAFMLFYFRLPEGSLPAGWESALRDFQRCVWAALQWTPVVAACGFAHRHLNRDSAARRYFTPAVFPVYILHQSLIVGMAHYAKPLGLKPAVEGPLLVLATFALCFGLYEIIRRVAPLRPLFGLDLRAKDALPAPRPQGLGAPVGGKSC